MNLYVAFLLFKLNEKEDKNHLKNPCRNSIFKYEQQIFSNK